MKRSFAWVPLLMIVAWVSSSALRRPVERRPPKAHESQCSGRRCDEQGDRIRRVRDARTQVATLRQNFTSLQGFWMGKKKEDAVAIIKDGLTRLDALDKILAAPTVDQMAAQAAAKEFGGNTCARCHKQYREGDAQSGFRFAPGVL